MFNKCYAKFQNTITRLIINTLTAAEIFRELAKNDNWIFSRYITKNSISRSQVSSKSKNYIFLGEKGLTNNLVVGICNRNRYTELQVNL